MGWRGLAWDLGLGAWVGGMGQGSGPVRSARRKKKKRMRVELWWRASGGERMMNLGRGES